MSMPVLKIERGVPIPPKNRYSPWQQLAHKTKPGDSFLVQSHNQRAAALHAFKKQMKRATSRKIDGEGYRVWRVA